MNKFNCINCKICLPNEALLGYDMLFLKFYLFVSIWFMGQITGGFYEDEKFCNNFFVLLVVAINP